MTKNSLASLPVKKIKIAPHSKRKYKKTLPPTVESITDMLEKCVISTPHYGIIYISLDFDSMNENYQKNTTIGSAHYLYLLVTRFLLSSLVPHPTIDLYPGIGPPAVDRSHQTIEVSPNLTIYLIYLTGPPTPSDKWLRYIEFYNHYDVDGHTYTIEPNPYRAILANIWSKKGHIGDGAIKLGETKGELKMLLIYEKIMEYMDNKKIEIKKI